jgi:hypothetical protein
MTVARGTDIGNELHTGEGVAVLGSDILEVKIGIVLFLEIVRTI